MQLVASFVQINPPCNLCKTDPLSASELSGKVEDALAGRSPLFSSLLHRLYKMARSGFSLCKKNTKHREVDDARHCLCTVCTRGG